MKNNQAKKTPVYYSEWSDPIYSIAHMVAGMGEFDEDTVKMALETCGHKPSKYNMEIVYWYLNQLVSV